MTSEQIFNILRPIVMRVTGVPECIIADGNISAPKGEYASIRPRQSIQERGQANVYTRNRPGDLVEVDPRAQVICTASVQFFRGDAMRRAELLKQCNKRPDVSMDLFRHKIGWLGTDGANNLTTMQSGNAEQRSQINIRLLYEVENLSEINNILSAEVDIHYETRPEVIARIVIE